MGDVLLDLRYAARTLTRQPGFTLVAVATLALGIGANTAVFSVVHSVLLQALPYRDPGRLVAVWTKSEHGEFLRGDSTGPDFRDWRERNRTFADLAAAWPTSVTWTGGAEPEKLRAARISASFLDLLGVRPVLGRPLGRADAALGSARVVALGQAFWQQRFGSDPGVIGRSLTLGGNAHEIVAVLPGALEIPGSDIAVWIPLPDNHPLMGERGEYLLHVVGRLRPDVSIAAAQSDMDAIAMQLALEHPATNGGKGVFVASMHGEIVQSVRPALLVLLGAVTFVLLIACANVASLLLGRALARRRELALRMALGAGRLTLLRQLLVEGWLVALLGAGAGLLVAIWGVDAFVAASAGRIPRHAEIAVDGGVFLFALALALVTGALFGLLPALQAFRSDVASGLQSAGRGQARAGRGRLRGALLALEVAACVVLLAGAGVMVRSLVRLVGVDPGFRAQGLLAARIALPPSRYADNARQLDFARQALERLRALPDVASAALVSHLPLEGDYWRYAITVDARVAAPGERERPSAAYRLASPDYFRTLGIPLVAGRGLSEQDDESAARVLVVNEAMARAFWPGTDPVGHHVSFSFCKPACEIVGVVGDVHHFGVDQAEEPALYGAYLQKPEAFMNELTLVLRARSDPAALVPAVKRELAAIDRDLPLSSVATMASKLSSSLAPRRYLALVLGAFALAALALCAIGIYGVLAYLVGRRRREIGIRMAVGAQAREVVVLVVAQGLRPVALGIGIGLVAALALTRTLRAFVFGIATTDPAAYAGGIALLVLVAFAAAYVPARRASRVDPARTLRCE